MQNQLKEFLDKIVESENDSVVTLNGGAAVAKGIETQISYNLLNKKSS